MEVSIDSSTQTASLAISDKGVTLSEIVWFAGRNHTLELLPNLERLVKEVGITMNSILAVFVAVGPGSYNGLRVALSTAKGIAYTLGTPIIGVSTLEIEAYPFASTGLPVCPVHDAARNELAVAIYQQCERDWLCIRKEHLTTLDDLCNFTIKKTVFCGEIPERVIDRLVQCLGNKAVIPEERARIRNARHLATLGWSRLQTRKTDDIATLQPIYLRRPHITTPKPKT